MQRKILKKLGVLLLLVILIGCIFTVITVAKNTDDGDPDDYGCTPVLAKNNGNQPLGKVIHKGAVRDHDFD